MSRFSCYKSNMTKLEDIQKAIAELPPDDLAKLRDWFDELEERLFDEQIERDALSGKLDWLAEEALAEHRAGRSRKLE
jgi:hypothetical protein